MKRTPEQTLERAITILRACRRDTLKRLERERENESATGQFSSSAHFYQGIADSERFALSLLDPDGPEEKELAAHRNQKGYA